MLNAYPKEGAVCMGVTIKEIAGELGLSPAAISLALRGLPGVSEETRRRIVETARQMGYPLEGRTNRSNAGMLQLVIYKRHGKIFSDTPFFESLIEGVAEEAAALGYHLSITYFYGGQDRQEQLKSILSLKCAGIILLATEMRGGDIQIFDDLGVPVMILDHFFPTARCDSVEIDNEYGAKAAVEYLIRCGHTRLGYLHSKVDIRNFDLRYSGYLAGCRALPERAAKDSARRIVRVGNTPEAAAEDMRAYLDTEPVLPTAFFADNDSIAVGCSQALLERGIRIPGEISVIGFDDSSLCQLLNPPLTTMDVHKERMGAVAVDRLHQRLCKQPPEMGRLLVRPDLVVRGTVLDRSAG